MIGWPVALLASNLDASAAMASQQGATQNFEHLLRHEVRIIAQSQLGLITMMVRLWKERIHPQLVFDRLGQTYINNEPPQAIKTGIAYEEARVSHFAGLTTAENTVALWGR